MLIYTLHSDYKNSTALGQQKYGLRPATVVALTLRKARKDQNGDHVLENVYSDALPC